ncbi:MAG: flagellar hook protein FlgE [Betaproteobacteria bacterium]
MGFQQGLSGLNASSKNLAVIGNNIANSSTVGFKSSDIQFNDVFATALTGGGGAQVGIGTKVGAIMQSFSQGNISITNNPLDIAINGNGFFRMADPAGAVTYSRNGQFHLDKDGYIVNASGLQLTGYTTINPTTGLAVPSSPLPIQLNLGGIQANPTTKATVGVNLDATSAVVPAVPAFSPTNAATFTSATALTAYDAIGEAHDVMLYFAKRTTVPGTWDVYMDMSGVTNAPPTYQQLTTLTFNPDGTIQAAGATPPALAYTPTNTATPLSISFNFADLTNPTTQFGNQFGVNYMSQDGYASGQLAGFSTSEDGYVSARYTNGQNKKLGQVVLYNFNSPNGLQPVGNNQWAESSASGPAKIGVPGGNNLGLLQSGAVEDSNVDLTAELVKMITAQRNYQANAQTIKTVDAVMQTLINLR